ncbi:Ubiquitin carboxyl-terminal hydrolase isozyme L3 [Vanrija pseudolonga]|uniref:Ubiquitin carboxyl-terminal hydrolase n=1 Tax=Vanrija pseudolonga TaxID=143232 RepID=A0AAF1BU58_9TREE|nr:Ubiquitin carboxyl-terminal hydrolase isozyme L3 [Vanrija pseudolonga]
MSQSKWVPLEASPDVFNDWSRALGLPNSPLSFQDLFSLDEEFLSFVPQPVKAVLLLFPSRGELAAAREKEESDGEGKWDGKDVWWIKQTIPNACGSIGLLHALLNLPEGALTPGSQLLKFKAATEALGRGYRLYRSGKAGAIAARLAHLRARALRSLYRLYLALDNPAHYQAMKHYEDRRRSRRALDRAKLLDEADFFESAHTAAAQAGQSAVPDDLDVDTHFIAFVQARNAKGELRVVELDGGREGPFDRGPSKDLLRDVAKIVQDKYIARAAGDINFNMIVLAGEEE